MGCGVCVQGEPEEEDEPKKSIIVVDEEGETVSVSTASQRSTSPIPEEGLHPAAL